MAGYEYVSVAQAGDVSTIVADGLVLLLTWRMTYAIRRNACAANAGDHLKLSKLLIRDGEINYPPR